jgi:hypothetical protein
MQQQDERASRPRLSAADETVLKLVLRTLGEGHYLTVSSVCTAWREAYSTIVQQNRLTCCKPYVQDAVMWMYIKELGLHESIPADLTGQCGCDSALADRLDGALDKLKLESTSEVTAAAGSSATDALEVSGSEVERLSTSADNDFNPNVPSISSNAKLHHAAVRRAELAAALKAKSEARLEAERIAKETAERLAILEDEFLVETVVPIVTGAAKCGRYAVCASTLAKLPRMSYDVHNKLLTSVVRAVANFAAKCKDAATFNLVLGALLVLSHARTQVTMRPGSYRYNAWLQWQAAAVVSNDQQQCDAALPLQQFAKLVYIQCHRGDQIDPIMEQLNADATRAAVAMVQDMWLPYDYNGGVKTALTWALARCATPEQHAHFVKEFAVYTYSALFKS